MIYRNGEFVSDEEVSISAYDRGFLLGDGLFETIGVWNGQPMDLAPHVARLTGGAVALGVPIPASPDQVATALTQLLEANGIDDHGVVRITLTRGVGPRGLGPVADPTPTLLMTATARPRPTDRVTSKKATVVSVVRHPGAITSRWKTLSYLDQIAALAQATERGFDDAILPNGIGGVAGASHANLFVVVGGQLITPRVADGALPGVTRAALLDAAGSLGIEAQERSVDDQMIDRSTEAFLTNSLIGVEPLSGIDGHWYQGEGSVGRTCQVWWMERVTNSCG